MGLRLRFSRASVSNSSNHVFIDMVLCNRAFSKMSPRCFKHRKYHGKMPIISRLDVLAQSPFNLIEGEAFLSRLLSSEGQVSKICQRLLSLDTQSGSVSEDHTHSALLLHLEFAVRTRVNRIGMLLQGQRNQHQLPPIQKP